MEQRTERVSERPTTTADLPASATIYTAVADCHDCEPTDLDPLYTVVDTDALDALFADTARTDASLRISFEYEGTTVELDAERGLSIDSD